MKTSRPWTIEQLDGIQSVGQSLLVSAAAGSGKTAVLAERCAYLVCDAKQTCEIDQLLVVTFTESAAAEMKTRIQEALRGRELTPRLQRQLALAENANVSTLHGFCARVLRQNFNLIGLDPLFDILDGDEAGLLRAEVARELFDRRYAAEDADDFRRLIDDYGDGNDERLIEKVVAAHELLSSLVDPAGWIARNNAAMAEAATKEIGDSQLGRALIEQVKQTLVRLAGRCRDAVASIQAIGGYPGYLEQLEFLQAHIDHWQQVLVEGGFDMLISEVTDFEMPKAPTIKGNPPGKELAKALLDAVKYEMSKGNLADLLTHHLDGWREGMLAVQPRARTFLELVAEFSDDYTAAKNAQRALDFSDLERLTLNILRDPESKDIAASEVARGYQNQFHHVLVDEYQDINEIQDAILTLLSRECVAREGKNKANLFCVGDVKQSIFRFRLAEPGRFLDRQERFGKGAKDAIGRVIYLRENFRSRSALLEAINEVFVRLMTRDAADIEYDQSHRLRAGRAYPAAQPENFRGAPIELHLMPADLSEAKASEADEEDETEAAAEMERADYEAILVARRIRQMMGMDGHPRMQVMQPDGAGKFVGRNIELSDIVILLRSMQFKADAFADALRGHGIPAHSEGGSGFFAAAEVRDILALLAILDNQQQDIPLAAVLRSPLAGLPEADDALARIRLAYADKDEPVAFHQAVRRYAAEQSDELAARLKDLFVDLDDLRDQARKRPVAELLWTIYDQTGFLAYCAGLDDGAQRVANLVELHERAQQFGTFLRQGLYRFLKFIQSLRERKEVSRPAVASKAEAVVKIMSIHKSKGLEFPVVVLPDLGKKHNLSDSRGAILVDRKMGLGMAVVDDVRRIRYPSLASTLVSASLLQQTLAEEMRLLYVAMTRAKEHLILIGTVPNDQMEQWEAQWGKRAGALPPDVVLSGRTQLDFLGPVAAMTQALPRPVFDVQSHDAAEVAGWKNPRDPRMKFSELQKRMAQLRPLETSVKDDAVATEVIKRFGAVYEHQAQTLVKASSAATAFAGHDMPESSGNGESRAPRKLDLPRFTQEIFEPNAAEVGTITHLVLQHWQFDTDANPQEIERRILGMVDRKIITKDQAKYVKREAIAWMLGTDLGKMLRVANDSLMRELPFALAVDPKDVLPVSVDPMDRTMIRGRIDLLVPSGENLSLVDYKTDRVDGAALEARAQVYAGQMNLYRDAIQRVCGKKVDAVYLIFLAAQEIRKC